MRTNPIGINLVSTDVGDVLPGPSPNLGFGTCDVLPGVDTRLVAAVQRAAGARCHASANLLQTYYFSLEAYHRRLATREGDTEGLAEAWAMLCDAKVRLRAFLTDCLLAEN